MSGGEQDSDLTKVRMAVPRYVLRGVSGASFGKTFPIYRATTLGRQSDCDLTISGEGLSRRHAELSIEGARLIVKDLGSANGTFINDRRVEEGELAVGDELRLDNVRFLVQAPDGRGEPADPTASTPEAPDAVRVMPWVVGVTLALAVVVAALLVAGIL